MAGIATPARTICTLDAAIEQMLREFAFNRWFADNHWPENEARVRRIVNDLIRRYPGRDANVLDVGCFFGYISVVIRLCGFEVTGADALGYPERDVAFEKFDIGTLITNLDYEAPFREVPSASFDAVVFGEIFEHILNHPLGVLQELARILKPGGMLVLTTPNPSTAINAARLLLDRPTLWGTLAFAEVPKLVAGRLGCEAHIHFREYRSAELRELLQRAGFRIEQHRYMPMGLSRSQGAWKRLLKAVPPFSKLLQMRLLGATQYVVVSRE